MDDILKAIIEATTFDFPHQLIRNNNEVKIITTKIILCDACKKYIRSAKHFSTKSHIKHDDTFQKQLLQSHLKA